MRDGDGLRGESIPRSWRLAAREGYRLTKSRRFDTYTVLDERNLVVAGGVDLGQGLTLDEVEEWLQDE